MEENNTRAIYITEERTTFERPSTIGRTITIEDITAAMERTASVPNVDFDSVFGDVGNVNAFGSTDVDRHREISSGLNSLEMDLIKTKTELNMAKEEINELKQKLLSIDEKLKLLMET